MDNVYAESNIIGVDENLTWTSNNVIQVSESLDAT